MFKPISLDKITAVVVTYNPSDNNIKQLNLTAKVFSKIYVVNNSPSFQPLIDFQACKDDNNKPSQNIIFINNEDNLGIATALNIGCRAAKKAGFEWLVTLDQDSIFKSEVVEKMVNVYNKMEDEKVASLCPVIRNHGIESKELIHSTDKNFVEVEDCIASANLIRLDVFAEVGGFRDKLFIDAVDADYCFKLREKGYKIVLALEAQILHEIGELGQKVIFNHTIYWDKHSPLRNYYIVRNNIFLFKKWIFVFPKRILSSVKESLIKIPLKTLLWEGNKKKQFKFMFKGLLHGLIGKYGKLK